MSAETDNFLIRLLYEFLEYVKSHKIDEIITIRVNEINREAKLKAYLVEFLALKKYEEIKKYDVEYTYAWSERRQIKISIDFVLQHKDNSTSFVEIKAPSIGKGAGGGGKYDNSWTIPRS